MSFFDQLQPASFRGVAFKVLGVDGEFGRRNAVHEYPFRDKGWSEDLGRALRKIEVVGFLIGDDVLQQQESLIAACESPGDGQLVHPAFGTLRVSLVGGLRVVQRWDRARYIELRLSFIEAGERQFPALVVATGSSVLSAADGADSASLADFITRADSALRLGASVVQQAVTTVQIWSRKAQRLANDATNLYNMVGTLKGSYGRYFGGRNKGGLSTSLNGISGTAGSIGDLISLGSAARTNVANSASSVLSLAQSLSR